MVGLDLHRGQVAAFKPNLFAKTRAWLAENDLEQSVAKVRHTHIGFSQMLAVAMMKIMADGTDEGLHSWLMESLRRQEDQNHFEVHPTLILHLLFLLSCLLICLV